MRPCLLKPTYYMPCLLWHIIEARVIFIKLTNEHYNSVKPIFLLSLSQYIILFTYMFITAAKLSAFEEFEAVYICFYVFLFSKSST